MKSRLKCLTFIRLTAGNFFLSSWLFIFNLIHPTSYYIQLKGSNYHEWNIFFYIVTLTAVSCISDFFQGQQKTYFSSRTRYVHLFSISEKNTHFKTNNMENKIITKKYIIIWNKKMNFEKFVVTWFYQQPLAINVTIRRSSMHANINIWKAMLTMLIIDRSSTQKTT